MRISCEGYSLVRFLAYAPRQRWYTVSSPGFEVQHVRLTQSFLDFFAPVDDRYFRTLHVHVLHTPFGGKCSLLVCS